MARSEVKRAQRTAASYPRYRSGPAQIDLLVYYQEGFPDDPELTLDVVLDVANKAFTDSGIELQLNVAAVVPLDIDAETRQSDVVPKMRNGESPFSSILTDRGFYEADLWSPCVKTLPEDDDACGAT